MTRLKDRDELVRFVRKRLKVDAPAPPARQLVKPPSLWHWLPFGLVMLAGLTTVQLGTAALDHWTSPRINESCIEHRDCGTDERCLKHLPINSRYCTRACADDTPCPAAMRCGDVATIPEANRGVGAAGAAAASSACVRN